MEEQDNNKKREKNNLYNNFNVNSKSLILNSWFR